MSLNIISSDKIAKLAARLKRDLQDYRKDSDLFAFTDIAVPNTNLGKWLQMAVFSKDPSLCAGINFPFIDSCLNELLLKGHEEMNIKAMPNNAYRFAIMKLLLSNDNPGLEPFREYIFGANAETDFTNDRVCKMAWQLTEELANLVDTYEVHRSDLIDKWINEANVGADGSIEKAEATLIRALFGENGVFPDGGDMLSLRQIFKKVKDTVPCGEAQRLFIFGHSILTPLQADILLWLAQKHEINFYYNNVCLEYWGDIQRETIKEKIAAYKDGCKEKDNAVENTLLQSWGMAGRETLKLLVDLEEKGIQDKVEVNWKELDTHECGKASLLEKIQATIRHRTSEIEKAQKQDSSLQIIGVPGIRREVEMVHNDILRLVSTQNDAVTFNDIAVLVPDMATYRPYIEAIFDVRNVKASDGKVIQVPYGLIDTSANDDSVCLKALEGLFDLRFDGLNRDRLFAVLDNPMVERALGITSDMVAKWRKLTSKINAFDFYDKNEMDDAGICIGEHNTWLAALKRLRLGMITENDGVNQKMKKLDSDDASRLSEVIELLHAGLMQAFPDIKSAGVWSAGIQQVIDAFIEVESNDVLEQEVLKHIRLLTKALDDMLSDSHKPLAFTREAIRLLTGGISCRHGSYLTDGVTIAGLKPMRPVPFKYVYVLGLGEGLFPGNAKDSSLNLKDLDKNTKTSGIPDINRFLFLETFMATGKRLVLSYVNRDLVSDAELFPSSIISTLKEFMPNVMKEEPNVKACNLFKELKLTLLESDSPHFGYVSSENLDAPLTSYSLTAWQTAKEVRNANDSRNGKADEGAQFADNNERAIYDPSAKELADFLKDPMRAVMNCRYGIPIEGYKEFYLNSEMSLDADRRELNNIVLDALAGEDNQQNAPQDAETEQTDQPNEDVLSVYQHNGIVPDGYYGERARRSVEATVSALSAGYHALAADTVKVFGGFGQNDTMPPDCTLLPLITWLMALDGNDSETKDFTVAVINNTGEDSAIAQWKWTVSGKEAKEYIDVLKERFRSYLNSAKDGVYVSLTYKKFAGAKSKAGENSTFEDILGELEEGSGSNDNWWSKSNTFNNDLSVQKIIDEYVGKLPESAELETIYNEMFKLPMSGIKQN